MEVCPTKHEVHGSHPEDLKAQYARGKRVDQATPEEESPDQPICDWQGSDSVI